MMKALVYTVPMHLAVQDLPIPEIGPTDIPYPLVPGHEFAGEVAAVGSAVTRFQVGDRVTAEPNLACNNCYYCHRNQQNFCENWGAIGITRAGGLAEYVTVPEANLFRIPHALTFAEAAMAEPLACVAYGLARVRPELGSSVLIYGAGTIGLLHLQTVRHGGAGEIAIVDIQPDRLDRARELGANHLVKAGISTDEDLRRISPAVLTS